MSAILKFLFPGLYWKVRGDGWRACEAMVNSRITKHYPDSKQEVWEKLVQ